MTDWQTIDAGPFHFHLPPQYEEVEVQGIDSYVRKFEGDGDIVSFDYGWYSDPLEYYSRRAGFSECEEQIGGLEAKVIFYMDETGDYVAAAHWKNFTPLDKLTIFGRTISVERQEDWPDDV